MKSFKLEKAPLILVLAQVVMSPVSAMEKYTSEIQDFLRNEGFPHFNEENVTELLIQPQQQPTTRVHKRWQFQSADQRKVVTLSQNAIVFQTNNYNTFDSFLDELRLILDTISKITQVPLAVRQGLRFVNYIKVSEDSTLGDFLDERLLGMDSFEEEGIENVSKRFEQVDKTAQQETLLTRIIQTYDGSFLPPDIHLVPLAFNTNEENSPFKANNQPEKDKLAAILEIDHFVQEQKQFLVEDLLAQFSLLHERLEQQFKTVTQESALKAWGYHEIEV